MNLSFDATSGEEEMMRDDKRFFVEGHARALTSALAPNGPIPALPLALGVSAALWLALLATIQIYLG